MSKNVIESSSIPAWCKDRPLFKYLKRKDAESLLFNNGQLRIGTLYDFRNLEKHGGGRGDEGEGTKKIFEKIDHTIIEDAKSNPLSPFTRQFINIKDGAKNTTLENIYVSQTQDSSDCYIFCMSKEFDEKLYKKFKADVCIKISSPYKFIHAISIVLKKYADFVRLSQCIYRERRQQYGVHDDYHASIIKPVTYKLEKEVRSIWAPKNLKNNDLEPLIINLQAKYVKRYCEKFHEK